MPSARTALAVALVTVALALQLTLFSRLPLPGATPDLAAARRRRRSALAYGPAPGWSAVSRPAWPLDLVPPADHDGRPVGAGPALVGYLAGLAGDAGRALGVRAAGGRRGSPRGGAVLLYAGLGALIGGPDASPGRRRARVLPTAVLYDVRAGAVRRARCRSRWRAGPSAEQLVRR